MVFPIARSAETTKGDVRTNATNAATLVEPAIRLAYTDMDAVYSAAQNTLLLNGACAVSVHFAAHSQSTHSQLTVNSQ